MKGNSRSNFRTALSLVVSFLAMTGNSKAEEWSTKISELLFAGGAVAHEYDASQEPLSRMLKGSLLPFKALTVNQPCLSESEVCILFIDRSTVENLDIRGRPRRILERLPGNLLAVKPNLVLVDSVLADQLVFATDLIGFSYSEYKTRLEEIAEQVASDKEKKISSVGASERQKSADALGTYAQSAVLAYVEAVRNHNVVVVNDEGAERLSAVAADNPEFEELWSALLWPIAHEIGHLKQFAGARVDADDLGLFGWFKNSEVRVLEDEADLFAQGVIKKYMSDLPQMGATKEWGFLPIELAAIGLTASASVWKWSGSRFVLFSRTARPFGSRLFNHQLEQCKPYADWKEENGLLMPPIPNQAVLGTYEDRLLDSKNDGLLLYTRSEWDEIKSNLSSAVDDENTHGFEYDRGKGIQSIIRDAALPDFFSAALEVDGRLDELIANGGAALISDYAELPIDKTVKLDAPFDHMTEGAGECVEGAICFVSLVSLGGEDFGREESIFTLTSNAFVKSDLLVWLVDMVFEPPSDLNEFSMSPASALIIDWLGRMNPDGNALLVESVMAAAFETFAEGITCGYGSRQITLPSQKEVNLTFESRCGCLNVSLR